MSPILRQYKIIHFATHAIVNDEQPGLSGIALSTVDAAGQPADGFLPVYRLYGLDLRADLVVISACRTALGKEVRGEGPASLARGFMHAGAPRLIASLWSVQDRATATLMQRLYAHLLRDGGLTPAAALRAAQLDMLRNPLGRSPRHWAAFELHGDRR
jgi:CHAT domain-containing protein